MRSFLSLSASLLTAGLLASVASLQAQTPAPKPAATPAATPAAQQLALPTAAPAAPVAPAASPAKVRKQGFGQSPIVSIDPATRSIQIGKHKIKRLYMQPTTILTREGAGPVTFESLQVGDIITGSYSERPDGDKNAEKITVRIQAAPAAAATPAAPAR